MKVVILILLVLFSTCAMYGNTLYEPSEREPSTNDTAIVGGSPASIRTYPFMVYYEIIYTFEFEYCDGTIISTTFILTAAHCLASHPESFNINVGSTTYFGGLTYRTNLYKMHPSYDGDSVDYDIGVITTRSEIHFNEVTKAVNLPAAKSKVSTGLVVTVIGWGKTSEHNANISATLRSVHIIVVDHDYCQSAYRDILGITPRMFCAGYPPHGGRGPCKGDSGGPAVNAHGVQVGIMSGAKECGAPGFPAVYTDVASLRDWVTQEAHV